MINTEIRNAVIEKPLPRVNKRPHKRCVIRDGPPGAQIGPHPVDPRRPSETKVSSVRTYAQSSFTMNSPYGLIITMAIAQMTSRTIRARRVGRGSRRE